MDSGKLITADDEIEVYVCDECGEHEAQIKVFNGMVCFQCWCSRRERLDDGSISALGWEDSYSEEEVFG